MQILLIDDDPEEHDIFAWVLKQIDSEIKLYSATSCKDALHDFSKEIYPQPNIIFIDGSMPHIGGKQCVLMLRENKYLKQVPIVIYAGSLNPSDETELCAMGIYKYLKKQHDMKSLEKELVEILKSLLSASTTIEKVKDDLEITQNMDIPIVAQ